VRLCSLVARAAKQALPGLSTCGSAAQQRAAPPLRHHASPWSAQQGCTSLASGSGRAHAQCTLLTEVYSGAAEAPVAPTRAAARVYASARQGTACSERRRSPGLAVKHPALRHQASSCTAGLERQDLCSARLQRRSASPPRRLDHEPRGTPCGDLPAVQRRSGVQQWQAAPLRTTGVTVQHQARLLKRKALCMQLHQPHSAAAQSHRAALTRHK